MVTATSKATVELVATEQFDGTVMTTAIPVAVGLEVLVVGNVQDPPTKPVTFEIAGLLRLNPYGKTAVIVSPAYNAPDVDVCNETAHVVTWLATSSVGANVTAPTVLPEPVIAATDVGETTMGSCDVTIVYCEAVIEPAAVAGGLVAKKTTLAGTPPPTAHPTGSTITRVVPEGVKSVALQPTKPWAKVTSVGVANLKDGGMVTVTVLPFVSPPAEDGVKSTVHGVVALPA